MMLLEQLNQHCKKHTHTHTHTQTCLNEHTRNHIFFILTLPAAMDLRISPVRLATSQQ